MNAQKIGMVMISGKGDFSFLLTFLCIFSIFLGLKISEK